MLPGTIATFVDGSAQNTNLVEDGEYLLSVNNCLILLRNVEQKSNVLTNQRGGWPLCFDRLSQKLPVKPFRGWKSRKCLDQSEVRTAIALQGKTWKMMKSTNLLSSF